MYALIHISQTCQVGQTGVFARPTLAPGPLDTPDLHNQNLDNFQVICIKLL